METKKQPTFGNGKICYVEIPANDIAISSAFYKNVFGWEIRINKEGNISFDDTVNEVSGTWVTGRSAATNPGLLIHIMVDNITVTIDKIILNGGKIVQSVGMDAPEITARFSDPAGNVLGLYQHGK